LDRYLIGETVCRVLTEYCNRFLTALLDHGADPTAKNDAGETALDIAESWDHHDSIALLKQALAARRAAGGRP
jgi:ankyrin repeat protein